jgi:hypothetical protein
LRPPSQQRSQGRCRYSTGAGINLAAFRIGDRTCVDHPSYITPSRGDDLLSEGAVSVDPATYMEAVTHHALGEQKEDHYEDYYEQETSNSETRWLSSCGARHTRQVYHGQMRRFDSLTNFGASMVRTCPDPDVTDGVIGDAIACNRPRTRYTVGREAALLPLLAILPDRMLDRILAAALRPHFPKENK